LQDPALPEVEGGHHALESLLRTGADGADELLSLVVATAREHLGMDVGFLAEFVGEREVFRRVAGTAETFGFAEEEAVSLDEMYCHLVVDGRISGVIPDVARTDIVKDMDVTKRANVGCYIGVPVRIPGGRVYGTLCSIGHHPNTSLTERDARFMRILARIVATELARREEASQRHQAKIDRIAPLLDGCGLSVVYQPIVQLATRRVVGLEALSRFPPEHGWGPDRWFAEAWEVGLGVELEVAAVRRAVAQLARLPPDVYLSVNLSAPAVCSESVRSAMQNHESQVVVEITEHAVIDQYEPLTDAVDELRSNGVRLAVDDAGAGYSGLSHILRLGPDIVKLDMYLSRGINGDAARQALATAAAAFGAKVGMDIVAEGVETEAEAAALVEAGVHYAQGYLFGRPAPLSVS
jgi:EAL domain-containing protein (putative c-di-GMP-specific phosphodiesterase class I)